LGRKINPRNQNPSFVVIIGLKQIRTLVENKRRVEASPRYFQIDKFSIELKH
jgi:hypothetical protein